MQEELIDLSEEVHILKTGRTRLDDLEDMGYDVSPRTMTPWEERQWEEDPAGMFIQSREENPEQHIIEGLRHESPVERVASDLNARFFNLLHARQADDDSHIYSMRLSVKFDSLTRMGCLFDDQQLTELVDQMYEPDGYSGYVGDGGTTIEFLARVCKHVGDEQRFQRILHECVECGFVDSVITIHGEEKVSRELLLLAYRRFLRIASDCTYDFRDIVLNIHRIDGSIDKATLRIVFEACENLFGEWSEQSNCQHRGMSETDEQLESYFEAKNALRGDREAIENVTHGLTYTESDEVTAAHEQLREFLAMDEEELSRRISTLPGAPSST